MTFPSGYPSDAADDLPNDVYAADDWACQITCQLIPGYVD